MRAALLAALASLGCACPGAEARAVEDAEGARVEVCAEIADTEAERARGLRGRPPLEPGEGLLLAFSVEDEICIVNDGVGFALDVVYARDDGTVVAVERAVPANDPTPRCHAPVSQVLELGAGALAPLGAPTVLR